MSVKQLVAWRDNNGSFQSGVDLVTKYQSLLKFPSRARILNSGETTYTRKLLQKCVDELTSNEEVVVSKVQESPALESPKVRFTESQIDSLPKELKALYLKIKGWYGELNEHMGILRKVYYTSTGTPKRFPKKNQGLAIIKKVMQLSTSINEGYEKLDYYATHGHTIPTQDIAPPPDKLHYWLKNQIPYTNYVRNTESRAKKGGKVADQPLLKYRKQVLQDIEKYISKI